MPLQPVFFQVKNNFFDESNKVIDQRISLVNCTKQLLELGLNKGASGNCSLRNAEGFLITPTGMPAGQILPEQLVQMNIEGKVIGAGIPSSEWRFHRDIYLARPEVQAVIHTHSPYATAFSCLRTDLPPFHYMIAMAGGDTIRCAPYATFGSQELSDNVVQSLQGRLACLMSNHGAIAVGGNIRQALAIAIEVESLCQQYLIANQLGKPVLLTQAEMTQVIEKFKGYGPSANQGLDLNEY
jgi:L-fuculose-phosphate aldolase